MQKNEKKILSKFFNDTRNNLSKKIGQPESQLSTPVSNLIGSWGKIVQKEVNLLGEVSTEKFQARPDYAVFSDGLLTGYIELKARGKVLIQKILLIPMIKTSGNS